MTRHGWKISVFVLFLTLLVSGLVAIGEKGAFRKRVPFPSSLNLQSTAALLVLGNRISLNKATASDLSLLPGIGLKRAQSIVEWRKVRGVFTSLDGLLEIPGIGIKTFEKIEPYLKINLESKPINL